MKLRNRLLLILVDGSLYLPNKQLVSFFIQDKQINFLTEIYLGKHTIGNPMKRQSIIRLQIIRINLRTSQ